MRTAIRASLVVGLLCWLLVAPPPANAESGSCGNRPGDADQVAAVRAMADAQCDCASTPDHDTYVNCVDEVAAAAVQNGALRPPCAGAVTSCAAQSTCGKPGFVTCCRTAADGGTRCSIKRSADACKPPPGGTACVGSVPSCCDACSAGGCGPSGSTTTTAPPATTTTTAVPATTTTTTTAPTATTTTTPPPTTPTTTLPLCAPIVTGQPISGTYQTTSLGPTDAAAVKVCTTNSTTNRFAICTSDADCGGATGTCAQTPWVDAGGVTQPTPTATTTFTVTAGSPPTCEHTVCIQCGAIGKCADIQGGCDNCGGGTDPACTSTSTNVNCPFGDECCQSPGFVLPAILIGPGVLNFCTKTSQFDCGFGVINTSNPQTGDNELTKEGDTSDPGPDCQYGTADDPALNSKACNSIGTGQGADTRGRIKVTKGNGANDASGIQIRMSTPELATTWSDGQGCPSNATFDDGESLVSQLTLAAEPTTAGMTGAFVELNGDTCKRVGAGFTNLAGTQDGPHIVGSPTVIPMPYGGGPFRSVAMNGVFSGAPPPFVLGFVAIPPTGAPTFQGAAQACTCSTARNCPDCDGVTTGRPCGRA